MSEEVAEAAPESAPATEQAEEALAVVEPETAAESAAEVATAPAAAEAETQPTTDDGAGDGNASGAPDSEPAGGGGEDAGRGRGRGKGRGEGGRGKGPRDPEDDLFADLRSQDVAAVKADAQSLRDELRLLDQELSSLQDARRAAINEIKLLREADRASTGVGQEQRALVAQLRELQEEVQALRDQRDAINGAIRLYLPTIEAQMERVSVKLFRVPEDPLRQPRPADEVELFSRLFELQAMHRRKRMSDEMHAQVRERSKGMRALITELDALRSKRKQVAEQVLEEAPHLDVARIDRRHIRAQSKRIDEMRVRLDAMFERRRGLRREAGRLDAWLRIVDRRGDGGPGRGGRGGGPRGQRGAPAGRSAADVRAQLSAGGALDLADLRLLLQQGGLQEALGGAPAAEPSRPRRAGPAPERQAQRQVGPSRGRRRRGRHEGGDARRR